MEWAALVTWVLTAGFGFAMLVIWLKNGGMQASDTGKRIGPAQEPHAQALAGPGVQAHRGVEGQTEPGPAEELVDQSAPGAEHGGGGQERQDGAIEPVHDPRRVVLTGKGGKLDPCI